MKRFCILALIGLLLSLPVGAEELSEAVTGKIKALIQLISKVNPDGDKEGNYNGHLISGLNQALSSGGSHYLDEFLGSVLLQRTQLGEPAVLLAGEIKTLILEEQRKASADEVKKLEDFFVAIGVKAKEAKQPADLDDVIYRAIDEENASQHASRREDPRLNQIRPKVSSAKSFLESWQDSLARFGAEDYQGAQSAMRSALNSNQNFLPRSEILARLSTLEDLHRKQTGQSKEKPKAEEITLAEIEEGLASLETMIPLVDRWVRLNQQPRGDYDRAKERIFYRLGNLVTTYERYKAGLPFDLSFSLFRSTPSEIPHEMMRLVNAAELSLAKLVLPRYLGLTDAPAATVEESLDDYFLRLIRHYVDLERPLEARRIASAQETLRISKGLSPDELMALRLYAAAQMQLTAGQPRAAVQSLHAALKTGSQLLPAKEIGQMLERLKNEHPEEYQLGTYQPLPTEVSITYTRSSSSFAPQQYSVETNLVMPVPGVSADSEAVPKPAATEDGKNPAVVRRAKRGASCGVKVTMP